MRLASRISQRPSASASLRTSVRFSVVFLTGIAIASACLLLGQFMS
ncbi:MAG: hypothetical protein SF053_00785 [Bacteroidia bacterium]|nr:hypothetical protein [Bacteroidia bacterium]